MYVRFCLVVMTCSTLLSVNAQFVDATNNLLLYTDHTGGFLGSGVSFADFNGDQIDDLTFGHHAGQIRYYQGDGDGRREVLHSRKRQVHLTSFNTGAPAEVGPS